MSSSRRDPSSNRGQLTPAIQRIVIGASMLDQTSSVTARLIQSVAPFAIGESDSCRIVRVKSSCRRKNPKRRTFDAWGNRTSRRARNILCPPVQRDGLCAPRYHRPVGGILGDARGCRRGQRPDRCDRSGGGVRAWSARCREQSITADPLDRLAGVRGPGDHRGIRHDPANLGARHHVFGLAPHFCCGRCGRHRLHVVSRLLPQPLSASDT
jgi:hypothetical protein